jgi:hypothetical protein
MNLLNAPRVNRSLTSVLFERRVPTDGLEYSHGCRWRRKMICGRQFADRIPEDPEGSITCAHAFVTPSDPRS